MRLIRLAMIAVVLAAALLLIAVVFTLSTGPTNGTLVSAGERRAYLLHVPPSYDPSVPAPLVISLHGFASRPVGQKDMSRWNDLADRFGFLVVYPAGTGLPLRWRAGGDRSAAASAPDVRFISDLIDKLQAEYTIDPRRIYANGLSNGGGMTFVLSCTLADRIAAVGMVAGLYVYAWDQCTPARPLPTVVFHGTADPIVPYSGGSGGPSRMNFPVIPDWVTTLAQRNGCTAATSQRVVDDVGAVQYTGCAADVVFYTIDGGGHTWPGGQPLPELITGRTTDSIDASRTMWDFFVQHPLPQR